MNIIISGAGDFGFEIAKQLSLRDYNLTVIEPRAERIQTIQQKLDLGSVLGVGTDYSALMKAGIQQCDVFIATADNDETNILSCALVKKLGNIKTIARVRQFNLSGFPDVKLSDFGVDYALNPDILAVQDLLQVMEAPGTFEVIPLANGQASIRGYVVKRESFVNGKDIDGLIQEQESFKHALIVAILRDSKLIFPRKDTVLHEGDKVYLLARDEIFRQLALLFTFYLESAKNVFVVGTNHSSDLLLSHLTAAGYKVKLFVEREDRGEELAARHPRTLIIQGTAGDVSLLEQEGIESCDAFIASSRNEDVNLIACLTAKRYGIPLNIIHSNKSDFFPFILSSGIDIINSPELSAIGKILEYTHEGGIFNAIPILFGKASMMKYQVNESSGIFNKSLSSIQWPKECIVALIQRSDKIIIPKGNIVFEKGDVVMLLTQPDHFKAIGRLLKR